LAGKLDSVQTYLLTQPGWMINVTIFQSAIRSQGISTCFPESAHVLSGNILPLDGQGKDNDAPLARCHSFQAPGTGTRNSFRIPWFLIGFTFAVDGRL
jgi:hypothetical protein